MEQHLHYATVTTKGMFGRREIVRVMACDRVHAKNLLEEQGYLEVAVH
ncbi:hypothetical protein [Burkholderia cenocepacia]|nr:hypothetical protein [Burkholderia cenocepacia]MCW3678796.1 hypothetical protein [Burkholderia cenocepacia]